MTSVESEYLESEDLSEFQGEWVAILDKKIIASGKTLAEAYEKILKKSVTRTPLYQRIPVKGEIDAFIL